MPRLAADLTPLRRYPTFRRLWIGQLISGLGGQLTIVGVSYQAYRLTHSTAMVGLVSLIQLAPLLVGSLVGGTVADARDRRKVLLVTQVILAATSAGLALNAWAPHPSLWPLFVCTAASAGFQGLDWPARNAALPMLVAAEDLASALALQSIIYQLGSVAGPSLAGLLIAKFGLGAVYGIDTATFAAAFVAVVLLPGLVPPGGGRPAGMGSIAEGLRFLRGQRFLAATFWIDLEAMVFGMPRAVFPALGLGLYGGGAATVGLLYAAPGAGALAGSLVTGWIRGVRHQGRALVLCMVVWGLSLTGLGLVPVLGAGLALLAVAGASDMIGTVFRNAVLQTTVPGELQGRLSGMFFAVASAGPRLGDAEAGAASAVGGPQFAVWSGGLACLAGLALLVWRVPSLWRQPGEVPLSQQGEAEAISRTVTELSEAEPAG